MSNPTGLLNKTGCICLFITAIAILECGIFTCGKIAVGDKKEEKVMVVKPIEEVLKENTQELMSVEGVTGIGQGLLNERSCITVFVIKISPELQKRIPEILEGYPVIVEETGPFKSF